MYVFSVELQSGFTDDTRCAYSKEKGNHMMQSNLTHFIHFLTSHRWFPLERGIAVVVGEYLGQALYNMHACRINTRLNVSLSDWIIIRFISKISKGRPPLGGLFPNYFCVKRSPKYRLSKRGTRKGGGEAKRKTSAPDVSWSSMPIWSIYRQSSNVFVHCSKNFIDFINVQCWDLSRTCIFNSKIIRLGSNYWFLMAKLMGHF